MTMNGKLQLEDGIKVANTNSYRNLVDGLIYVAHIRPNVAYFVGVIFKFTKKPTN